MVNKPTKGKAKEEASRRKRIVRKALLFVWGIFFLGILLFTGLMFAVSGGLFGALPDYKALENPKSYLATEIFSANGELLGTFFRENRTNVNFDELSPFVVDALVATEDRRYYEHSGIDSKGLLRVFFKSFLLGHESSGGGSTISQQLAKNLFHDRPSSKMERALQKLKEWIIAVRLEKRYTKNEILTMYLNTVEFVNQADGIKSASRVYFSTTPDSLKLEEAATLVGMVKNPSLYNPVRFPDRALTRRNVVFNQMVKYGYLDQEVADSLKQMDLGLAYNKVDHNEGLAPYFREHLRSFMKQWAHNNPKPDGSEYDIYSDGLRIYTTIDSRVQKYAEEAVAEHLTELQKDFIKHWDNTKGEPWNYRADNDRYDPDFLKKKMRQSERYRMMKVAGVPADSIELAFNTPREMRVFSWDAKGREIDTVMTPMDSLRYYVYFLQAGFSVADPYTGEILAWVGGIDHRHFQLDHVTTRRQVGSTFKPFVYTAAITELGYSPCQKFPNIDYPNPKYHDWTPRNSSNYKNGEMIALWDALAHSVNKITAKLMLDIDDPKNVIKLVREMGVTADIPPVPSIALGTCDLSVYEMVGAYTTYVNHGIYSKPYFVTRIEDKYGNVIARFSPESHEVLRPEVAYVMIHFLQKVVTNGTARRLVYKYGFKNEIGGKTGTTQDNSDGWFMGVTPELVASVWVGGDDPVMRFRYTSLGQGANMALPIYALFMQKAYADSTLGLNKEATFPDPAEGHRTIEIDCSKYEQLQQNQDYHDLNQGLGL